MEPNTETTTSKDHWYYVQAGRRIGPVTINSLQYLFQHQSMPPDTLVWNPDLPEWQPAHQTSLAAEIPALRSKSPQPRIHLPRHAVIPEPFGDVRFYYVENSREKGPVSYKKLFDLLLDNKIPPNTMIRRSGNADWYPAREIFAITDKIIAEPPQLPTFWAAKAKEVPDFQKTRVITVIILTIVTSAIYYPIWFIRRGKALNSLQSPVKLNRAVFIVAIIFYALSAIVDIGTEFTKAFGENLLDSGFLELSTLLQMFELINGIALANTWLTLIIGIVMLIQSFRVKRILQDHYNKHLGQNIAFSGLAVFFLQVYYLQYKINRLV